jgi:hypothetical protein
MLSSRCKALSNPFNKRPEPGHPSDAVLNFGIAANESTLESHVSPKPRL